MAMDSFTTEEAPLEEQSTEFSIFTLKCRNYLFELQTILHFTEAVHKKSLFPVQRVAKIKASWAAAIPPPPPLPHTSPHSHFFFLVGKYCPFLGKKDFLQKGKKKVSSPKFLATRPVYQKQLFSWTA